MPTFTLTGARGFETALARAGEEAKRQVERVNRETAFAVRARAESFAPKDRGDLARNISAQGKGMNWRVGVLDVELPSRGGRNTAHLNPSVYGVWYEYGFVTRKIAKHPFMRPAVDAEEGQYQSRLQSAVAPIEHAAKATA